MCLQAFSQGDLHVKGKIKSDSLVNSGYRIIIADSSGTLDTLEAGAPGQVLISNGGTDKPQWRYGGGTTILYHNLNVISNTSSATAQLMDSFLIPGNTLVGDGDWLEVEYNGYAAAPMTNGTIDLIIGGDTIFNWWAPLSLSNGERTISGKVKLSRIGGGNQRSIAEFIYYQTGNNFLRLDHTLDLSQGLLISIYTRNPTGVANTFTIYDFSVRLIR